MVKLGWSRRPKPPTEFKILLADRVDWYGFEEFSWGHGLGYELIGSDGHEGDPETRYAVLGGLKGEVLITATQGDTLTVYADGTLTVERVDG